jgi:type II secretory ATPase GspE/PulE/Tfp pilus assembly ATPase PilB-like protein
MDSASETYATGFVHELLSVAQQVQASDVHLQPVQEGLRVCWRLDGVLQFLGIFPPGQATSVVSRLKVLSDLLTYRTDVPQEGRIREVSEVEMRVSTFPTLFGERAVIRFFGAHEELRYLEQLRLPDPIPVRLNRLLAETSGGLLITGPAGSGKTTTIYACLRELVRATSGGRSVVSLEDPIEVAVEGVAQSQVNEPAGLTLATGLKSLLRQDPEVIMVGEIRDRDTAEVCMQASLTGQLVITTLHTGRAAGAISRLMDMGIEPYLLRSGLLAILSQRLVRCLCQCSRPLSEASQRLGLPVSGGQIAVGCEACRGTGYRGRRVLAELLELNSEEMGNAVLQRSDATCLHSQAIANGMTPLWTRAIEAVEAGWTSPREVRRVLGFRHDPNGGES